MLVLMTEPVEILLLCQSLKAEERRGIVETAHAVRPDMKCTVVGVDGPDSTVDAEVVSLECVTKSMNFLSTT